MERPLLAIPKPLRGWVFRNMEEAYRFLEWVKEGKQNESYKLQVGNAHPTGE